MRSPGPARLLMCPPDYFEVTYAINPWMTPQTWSADIESYSETALREWRSLRQVYDRLGAEVVLIPAQPGLPDMVFTANHAIVLDGKVLIARFAHAERQGEEKYVREFFETLAAQGEVGEIHELPEGCFQEGAGDCCWDPYRQFFIAGYGQRSEARAYDHVRRVFGRETLVLELVDRNFYHMDLCVQPLSRGHFLYYPAAFSASGRAALRDRVGADLLIAIEAEDAHGFALNSVNLGDDLVMPACSDRLAGILGDVGYRVTRLPLTAFSQAGGAVWCSTLRLDRESLSRSCATTESVAVAG